MFIWNELSGIDTGWCHHGRGLISAGDKGGREVFWMKGLELDPKDKLGLGRKEDSYGEKGVAVGMSLET